MQSRYYDPVTHRFINADRFYDTGTSVLGYNMFLYCNNNPVNRSDPSGMSSHYCGDPTCVICRPERREFINNNVEWYNTITGNNIVSVNECGFVYAISDDSYKYYSNAALGMTIGRGALYSTIGKSVEGIGSSCFIGTWGTLLTVPISNQAHRMNPYLTDCQKNKLYTMEWVAATAAFAVPFVLANFWNPLGWTAGTIALIGIGISTVSAVTISCMESYYMKQNGYY